MPGCSCIFQDSARWPGVDLQHFNSASNQIDWDTQATTRHQLLRPRRTSSFGTLVQIVVGRNKQVPSIASAILEAMRGTSPVAARRYSKWMHEPTPSALKTLLLLRGEPCLGIHGGVDYCRCRQLEHLPYRYVLGVAATRLDLTNEPGSCFDQRKIIGSLRCLVRWLVQVPTLLYSHITAGMGPVLPDCREKHDRRCSSLVHSLPGWLQRPGNG